MKFLMRAINARDISEVEVVSKRWDSFDTALNAGISKIAVGAVGREILLYQEQCGRNGTVATGLSLLYLVLKRYELDHGQALQVDYSILQNHKYNGRLEEFLDGLDSKLSNLTKEPDPDWLLVILEPEFRKHASLGPEFVTYDRAAPGTYEKCLRFLYDAGRSAVARERKQQNLASMLPRDKVKAAVAKPTSPAGNGKPKGNKRQNEINIKR